MSKLAEQTETRYVLEWIHRKSGESLGYYDSTSSGHWVDTTMDLADARYFYSVEQARRHAGAMRNMKLGGFPKTKAEWLTNPPYRIHKIRITFTIAAWDVPLFTKGKHD